MPTAGVIFILPGGVTLRKTILELFPLILNVVKAIGFKDTMDGNVNILVAGQLIARRLPKVLPSTVQVLELMVLGTISPLALKMLSVQVVSCVYTLVLILSMTVAVPGL